MSGQTQGKRRFSSFAMSGKRQSAWKIRSYAVPMASRRGYRWKATALRTLQPLMRRTAAVKPVTVVVPALYSHLPGETVAMGWLNEIGALGPIHQRMTCAANITGWDVFTFHTLHNLDPYFNTTIAAVHETWVKEGTLSREAVLETKRRFSNTYDYHRITPRLVENLVFQSSLLDWMTRQAEEVPLTMHFIGTALLSALVSSGSIPFEVGVHAAVNVGKRWDDTVSGFAGGRTAEEIGWARFQEIRRLIEGRSKLAAGVAPADMPAPIAPQRPFWYSATPKDPAILISTAVEARSALETMNLSSWSSAMPVEGANVRGWLASPLHPVAKACRWSFSNYLLATPDSARLFIEHIATLAGHVEAQPAPEKVQNRFRLSRIKVTGP